MNKSHSLYITNSQILHLVFLYNRYYFFKISVWSLFQSSLIPDKYNCRDSFGKKLHSRSAAMRSLKRSSQTLSHNIVNWMHPLAQLTCARSQHSQFARNYFSSRVSFTDARAPPDNRDSRRENQAGERNDGFEPRGACSCRWALLKFLFAARNANTPSKRPVQWYLKTRRRRRDLTTTTVAKPLY